MRLMQEDASGGELGEADFEAEHVQYFPAGSETEPFKFKVPEGACLGWAWPPQQACSFRQVLVAEASGPLLRLMGCR